MIGRLLNGRYRLDRVVGRGGMGEVYQARDTRLERDVAVKLLTEGGSDAEAHTRLLREARAAARLHHPNIVAVFDAAEDGGTPYIAMELVEGRTLREAGPLSLEALLQLAREVSDALDHAHASGVVHRDLKPENLLIAANGTAKVADLGIARMDETMRLTSEGTLVGTAGYMSPEQALGQPLDGRADLYSLGVVMYEQLTGRLPFVGDDPLAVISQHLNAPVVPPRTYRADVPPALELIVVRCLAKRPADRFGSAHELSEALAAVKLGARDAPATPAAPSSDAVALLDQLARGRLIGRRSELGELRELWLRAQRGQGHVVLVSGEPGIGKTRLLHELSVFARLGGGVVLRGGCYEFEGATPYLPFVEGLRRWVDEADDEALRGIRSMAEELARLVPEIERRLGPFPPRPNLTPQEERLRLFDAFARFVQALADAHGVLLVLDDLHWADHGSIALLHFLARNLRDRRVLVLGAYREVELDRAHPLDAALVEWNRERLVTRIPLGRLGLQETSTLLATLFGQEEVSPDFAEALHRETEGNPFFIEEVVKSLIESGQIYREAGEWQRRDVAELAIPQSIRAAVGRRLQRLSPECGEVLRVAAALGKVFEFAELAAVSGGGEEHLLDALDEAGAAQLVRADAGESFTFTHDKIREVLHEELNPIRRRRLHQRIGEGLERLHHDRLDEKVQDLAYHFVAATHFEKGLDYSIRAADRAERLFAHEEALAHLSRARECAEALERTDALLEIEQRTGSVLAAQSDFRGAVTHYERALALATEPRRRASLKGAIGEVYTRSGDQRGPEFLEAALAELDPETQANEYALAIGLMGRYYHYRGDSARALVELERAVEIAEPHDDGVTLGRLYSYLAGALQHLARLEESMEWGRRCIALGERKQLPEVVALGYEFLSEDSALLARFDDSLRFALLDREWGARCGSLERVAWSRYNDIGVPYERGQLARALESAEVCLGECERIGEARLQTMVLARIAEIMADLRRDPEAAEVTRQTISRSDASGDHHLRVLSRKADLYVRSRAGDWAGALAPARELAELLSRTPNGMVRLQTAAQHTRVYLENGELEECGRWIEHYSEVMAPSGARFFAACLAVVRALWLCRVGRAAEGERSLDEAIVALDALDCRLEAGRARMDRAALRRQRGDHAGARADFEAARARFETCGAPRDLEHAERALASLNATA